MARKPRTAPSFTPEELDQISNINRRVLNEEKPKPVPIEPPGPQPGGMGMQGGKAGGFWYARGGKAKANPFAQGGKVLPRT